VPHTSVIVVSVDSMICSSSMLQTTTCIGAGEGWGGGAQWVAGAGAESCCHAMHLAPGALTGGAAGLSFPHGITSPVAPSRCVQHRQRASGACAGFILGPGCAIIVNVALRFFLVGYVGAR
jgi:hypothetical protein